MQGLIDMHCHIVPGVDDGARDLYDAAKILQLEYRNQVQSVIVTPHYRAGMFETPQKEVERQFQRIDEMTRRSRSGMRVYLGCEYHTNAHMVEDLKKGLRPTMAGTEYVLVEFSGRHNYQIIRNQVYALLAAGYRPIIAHAERYPCLTKFFYRKQQYQADILPLLLFEKEYQHNGQQGHRSQQSNKDKKHVKHILQK